MIRPQISTHTSATQPPQTSTPSACVAPQAHTDVLQPNTTLTQSATDQKPSPSTIQFDSPGSFQQHSVVQNPIPNTLKSTSHNSSSRMRALSQLAVTVRKCFCPKCPMKLKLMRSGVDGSCDATACTAPWPLAPATSVFCHEEDNMCKYTICRTCADTPAGVRSPVIACTLALAYIRQPSPQPLSTACTPTPSPQLSPVLSPTYTRATLSNSTTRANPDTANKLDEVTAKPPRKQTRQMPSRVSSQQVSATSRRSKRSRRWKNRNSNLILTLKQGNT